MRIRECTNRICANRGGFTAYAVGALANSHEINFKNWVSLRTIAHRIYIHPSFDGEYFFSFFGGEFTGCVFDGMLFRETADSRHAVDGTSKALANLLMRPLNQVKQVKPRQLYDG